VLGNPAAGAGSAHSRIRELGVHFDPPDRSACRRVRLAASDTTTCRALQAGSSSPRLAIAFPPSSQPVECYHIIQEPPIGQPALSNERDGKLHSPHQQDHRACCQDQSKTNGAVTTVCSSEQADHPDQPGGCTDRGQDGEHRLDASPRIRQHCERHLFIALTPAHDLPSITHRCLRRARPWLVPGSCIASRLAARQVAVHDSIIRLRSADGEPLARLPSSPGALISADERVQVDAGNIGSLNFGADSPNDNPASQGVSV
jgi:hypothetical protein